MYLLIYIISAIICVFYFSYEANSIDNQFKKFIYMIITLPVIVLPIVNTVAAMFVSVDYLFTSIEKEEEDV